jgi:hypothetical protein
MYWRNQYIFDHWTSQILCARYISIWAPLVVRHTSRWYSLSRQVLANVSS